MWARRAREAAFLACRGRGGSHERRRETPEPPARELAGGDRQTWFHPRRDRGVPRLGGGRTERLLDRREAIDVEEVAAILNVIGVEPADFFGEVFPPGVPRADAAGVGKDADG